jgi:hypothetical protein
MKKLTLCFALFVASLLCFAAAPVEPTPLRKAVDVWVSKNRILVPAPAPWKPTYYTFKDMLSAQPSNDKMRKQFEAAVIRDADILSVELSALAKLADNSSGDQKLVGQFKIIRAALDSAKTDKAKIAEAIRQIAALR